MSKPVLVLLKKACIYWKSFLVSPYNPNFKSL
jgi:hypothetical protein